MVGIKGRTGVKPPEVVKRNMVKVRLNDEQMRVLREFADERGINLSVLVRAIFEKIDMYALEIDKNRQK